MANATHGENSYWYIIRKSCVECRMTISNHLFSKYAGLILLVFAEWLLSLAPQLSRRHIFATVCWCWNCECTWCPTVSHTLKKVIPRMIVARAICITRVHNRQVCLFIFVFRVFLKDVKLHMGLSVVSKRSFSFVPYLLWYPGVQDLGYLILELYIKS